MTTKQQPEHRAAQYLAWVLDAALPDHEHLLAGRVEVPPGDDFMCPLCEFLVGAYDELGSDPHSAAVVEFARTHPTLAAEVEIDALLAVARPWVREVLGVSPLHRYVGQPHPDIAAITMGQVVKAAADKTNTAAEALARVWSGWTVHRVVSGNRRNTTCVVSSGERVGLIRMLSFDYWAYTLRDVPPAPWPTKTVEERLAILIDSVQTAQIAASVPDLIDRVARAGTVTTKGDQYQQRVRALMLREVRAAFPGGRMP